MRPRVSNTFGRLLAMAAASLPPATVAAAQDSATSPPVEADTATPANDSVTAARAVFDQWIAAFRAGEYEAQWQLVDPRMRYWVRKDRYVEQMRRSARRRGDIESFSIAHALPVSAEQIPCTEQRHCFRKNVEYVMFVIRSRYKGRSQPPQPEYAVMSMSEEGWRYGGGTFPYRPLGETAVLLDEVDEARYRQRPTAIGGQ